MSLSWGNGIEKEKQAQYDKVWNEQSHLIQRVSLGMWKLEKENMYDKLVLM